MHMMQFNPTDHPDAAAGSAVTTTFTIKVSGAAHAAAPFVNQDVSVHTVVANRAPRDIALSGDNVVREATAGDDDRHRLPRRLVRGGSASPEASPRIFGVGERPSRG